MNQWRLGRTHAVVGDAPSGIVARRYPGLGFMVAAGLLATLLPSALRVPLSGPSTSAELAPVPGKSDGAKGDLSAFGTSSGRGLGSGPGGEGGSGGSSGADGAEAPDAEGGPGGSGRSALTKKCVGKPARQTEDPWSPFCVGHFDGDNFGATAKGVTREEITIVLLVNCRSDGSSDIVDISDPKNARRAEATVAKYFNDRYQLYKRQVRLYLADAEDANTACAAAGPAAVRHVDEKLSPFLVLDWWTLGLPEAMAREAATLGTMSIVAAPLRSLTQRLAPFSMSLLPDIEDRVANTVEAVCERLAGLPARAAGDPSMHGTTRRFGIWYQQPNSDPNDVGAGLVRDGIQHRCGAKAREVELYFTSRSGRNVADAITEMKLDGVTTVLTLGATSTAFTAAEAVKWYPEWLLVDQFYVGHNANVRLNVPPPVARGLLGLMERRRAGEPREQPHMVAFADLCDRCVVPKEFLYTTFLFVYTGIQSAGPRLNAANVERGLRALPARQSRDPFVPSAYFTPGNHSFMKDFALVWWDPSGKAPGWSTPGCWRLPEEGLRYRAQDWAGRLGDADVQRNDPPQPCQGELFG